MTSLDLDTLALQIRAAHEAVSLAVTTALDQAMVAGDALSLAHQYVRHGDWEVWLAEYCDLSARTARVYMSLARNRETIDANRQHAADLSLRGALRLITKPTGPKVKTAKAEPRADDSVVLYDWKTGQQYEAKADDEQSADDAKLHVIEQPPPPEITPVLVLNDFFEHASGVEIFERIPADRLREVIADLLDHLTVDGMLANMSPDFGRALRARLPAPKRQSSKPKFKTMQMARTITASGDTVYAAPEFAAQRSPA